MADFYASQFERAKAMRVIPRLVHQSCAVAMLPPHEDPDGPRTIPWIERPGHTLNLGRNKRKREHRASKESRKHWQLVA